jgi:MATE family multidrug resistance protein
MSLVGRLPSTTALHAVQGFAACNPSLLKNNACNVSLASPLTLSFLSLSTFLSLHQGLQHSVSWRMGSMSKPIKRQQSGQSAEQQASRSFGTSYRSGQNALEIAEQSIARDCEEDNDGMGEGQDVENALSRTTSHDRAGLSQLSMAGNYRRPSWTSGAPRPFMASQQPERGVSLDQEREAAIREERSLLRDNNLLPRKHSRQSSSDNATGKNLKRYASVSAFSSSRHKSARMDEEEATGTEGEPTEGQEATESTTLLNGDDNAEDPAESAEAIDAKWEEAVLNGQIQTNWRREAKVLVQYSAPLMLTFILQNSLTLTSVFTVGHIGKIELGAVSLGSMTANITGYAVYHGLATSLDTLCSQAYGSGRKKLVGLQLQRMVFFLWVITIPIAAIWLAGGRILAVIVPEKETAELAGLYLKVLVFGAPGYALFESAKRYVQAQGRFAATMYVLLICAPLNVFLHWLLVWHLGWGFIGCPIAVVTTETLMPILLFLYVRFVGGMECWPGFSRKAFVNWGPMIRLALPGLVMVIAEFLAFEILTLGSSRISAEHLAANTILQSLCVLTYQLPFPLSIAASTRVANLIGATLPDAARVTARVTFIVGTALGVLNMLLLSIFRDYIPRLYTSDPDVIRLAAGVLPLCAAFQLFDALAAVCNGLLRGLGKQEVGGYINLFAYYVVSHRRSCPSTSFPLIHLYHDRSTD